MSEHPVRRKLRVEIVPYLVTAHRLRRQWFYRLHGLFGTATDVLVALSALGISSPLLDVLSGTLEQGDGAAQPSLAGQLAVVPEYLLLPTATLVLFWVILRVSFQRQEGSKRAVLAKSCTMTLRHAEAKLPRVLTGPDPMPELARLLNDSIIPVVDRTIQESAWPWTPFALSIEPEVNRRVEELCRQYEQGWAPPPLTAVGPDANGGS